MEIYIKLFEVVFPVFFVVGIGYYLGKKNPKIDTKFITNFAANIGTPAMVIYAVTSTGINFEIFRDYFWYYLLAIICFSIVGIINLFLINTKDIIRELPPLIFPNTGNMGLPICLFAYGSQGLGVSASITSLIILMHFTVGVFLADRKFNLDVIIKNPPFYAIIFSAIVLFYEIDMPVFLILMSLGIALTRLKVFSLNKAVISSITRMFIGPLIGIGLIWFFDLEGFAAGVLLIQCSMPSAVLNYLVGSIYSPKKVVDSVASTIVVSTLMSFITIPIVVYFALRYFS